MSELARLTSRSKPTVTVLVKKLVRQGYVTRSRDHDDARVFNVSLTKEALTLARDLGEISHGMRSVLFKGFTDRQKKYLTGLVKKALDNFHTE